MKPIVRFLLRLFFGFRSYGKDRLPSAGPALLVPNHVSWMDWLFLGAVLEDDWKFVVSSVTADLSWAHRWVMRNRRTFPIDMDSPYAMRDIAKFLKGGGRLVLFAEGRITSTGSQMKLFEGTGFLLQKSDATVLTAYLRGAVDTWWVEHNNYRRLFPRVSVHFSEGTKPPAFEEQSSADAREAMTDWLLRRMIQQRFDVEVDYGPKSLPERIVEAVRRTPKRIVFEDTSHTKLSMKRMAVGASVLGAALERLTGEDVERVGVALPSVNATPVTLLALWSIGKTPAMLNFTAGPNTMAQCAELAGLRQVITSRRFIEKAKLDFSGLEQRGIRLIYLEDVRPTISKLKKLTALANLTLRKDALIRRRFSGEETAIVLFTSGSEGMPKGVELTHGNLIANVEQILSVVDIQDHDRIFNPLPLFHCFGLTIGTLLPMTRGIYSYLYPNPLSYKVIPSLVYRSEATITMGSNTFLRGYARFANPYDFRTLRVVFAGAEKLRDETFDLWSAKFGVRILQGYGATETSPVVSVNTPLFPRKGSVGRLIPGVETRFDPVDGVANGGRILVKGPNIMKGYLNADADAKFQALDGWYDTGDIGRMDADGYVYIDGRLKRFAKISGEMVSLTAVEEALARAVETLGEDAEASVVAVPDTDKGERLIVVTNRSEVDTHWVRQALQGAGLPNLAVPREVTMVEELPKLGTGKTDFPALARLVEERIGMAGDAS